MVLFPIATGGERLYIPDGDHDKVKETIVACQSSLEIDEDIVFEGHGNYIKHDPTTTLALQRFFPKELAQMAADIKKPDDWQGQIILFGCRTGNIALKVAKEYYNLTKKSVTVVGPKEKVFVLKNPLNPSNPLFGFTDSEKTAELDSNPNFLVLERISSGFSHLLPLFEDFLRLLTAPLLKPEQSAQEILKFVKEKLIKPMFNLSRKIEGASDDFYSHYPRLKKNFHAYPVLYRMFKDRCLEIAKTLFKIASSPESDDGTITGQMEHLRDFTKYAIDLSKCIHNECFAEHAIIFKSGLDFGDTKMMISATYTAEDEDIELALAQRIALFKDHG